jgi:hypothetical protein
VCAKISRDSAWESSLGPLGVGCFSGNCSLLWVLDFWNLGTCYLLQEVLVYYFLFVFSILYTKMHWSVYSLADTFWPFNSFPQIRVITWGTCLPCLHPSWIYCTEKQCEITLFQGVLSFLPAVTTVASWIILFIRTCLLSVHTWTVTSPFLWYTDCPVFTWLASCSRSSGMPLASPHSATILTFLSTMFQLISLLL